MGIYMKKQNTHQLFKFLFGVLLALIFVRYVLQIAFPWEILLALVAIIAVLGDRDEIIAMCVCCVPLYTSLQYIYALLICMVFYAVKFREDLRIDGGIFPVIVMLVWELLHCFDPYSSVLGGIRALVPLIFCTFLMFCPREQISYPFVVRSFAFCVAGMCLIVLSKLLAASGFNVAQAFANMQRLGTASENAEVIGADFNPNFLGFVCIIASTGLLQLKISGQSRKYDMAYIAFLLLCGLLTLSRTFLVCLALMAVLFILTNRNNIGKALKMTGGVLVAVLAVCLVMLAAFPNMIENWIARFQVADITAGRLDLMALFHKRIFEAPDIYLFGIGIQSVTAKVIARFGAGKILGTVVPHNAVQEMVFCWGIPGLLLMIIFLCTLVTSAKRKNPNARLINYIPLILLLVKIQAGQLLTTPSNMLIIALTYLSMCYPFYIENRKE